MPKGSVRVLICSANMGNAEPDALSMSQWVPHDGNIEIIAADTMYPIPSTDKEEKYHYGTVDLIVVAMQEATFSLNKDKGEEEEEERATGEEQNNVGEESDDDILDDYDEDGLKFNADGTVVGKEFIEKSKNKRNKKIGAEDFKPLAIRSAVTSMDLLKSSRGDMGKDSKLLIDLLNDRCPSFTFVVNRLHGGMRLMILAKNNLVSQITDLCVKSVSTGIGSVLANKGGIVATFTIEKTRLSFLSCHLEAHEGEKHYKGRNANMASIFDGSKPSNELLDITLSSHHIFVAGDLNYRLKFPSALRDTEVAGARTLKLVQNKAWGKLNDLDELAKGVKLGHVFQDFDTLKCNFPPTFKVQRQDGLDYIKKRTPSYTDRILWKSSPGIKQNVLPIIYEPIVKFTTSDHKPIRGAYEITLNAGAGSKLKLTARKKRQNKKQTKIALLTGEGKKINFEATEFHCQIKDTKKDADEVRRFYMRITTNIKCILDETKNLCTRDTELEPYLESLEWDDTVKNIIDTDNGLYAVVLYISLVEQKSSKKKDFEKDQVIGTAEFCLIDILSEVGIDLHSSGAKSRASAAASSAGGLPKMMNVDEKPLCKNGQIHGYLSCSISAWKYSSTDLRQSALTRRTSFMDKRYSNRLSEENEGSKLKKLFCFCKKKKQDY